MMLPNFFKIKYSKHLGQSWPCFTRGDFMDRFLSRQLRRIQLELQELTGMLSLEELITNRRFTKRYEELHFTLASVIQEGITNKIRFHDLRHSFASNYMMNGGNVFDLQKILGHTDIKMTMRYAHFTPEHLQGSIKFMNMLDESNMSVPYLSHDEEKSQEISMILNR